MISINITFLDGQMHHYHPDRGWRYSTDGPPRLIIYIGEKGGHRLEFPLQNIACIEIFPVENLSHETTLD